MERQGFVFLLLVVFFLSFMVYLASGVLEDEKEDQGLNDSIRYSANQNFSNSSLNQVLSQTRSNNRSSYLTQYDNKTNINNSSLRSGEGYFYKREYFLAGGLLAIGFLIIIYLLFSFLRRPKNKWER